MIRATLWPSSATAAADFWPTPRPPANSGNPFVRTTTVFVALKTCSGAKSKRFRTAAISNQWTRTQRIRTAAVIPLVAMIVDAGSTPVYVTIASKAAHFRHLGMSNKAIATALGVSDKTVAKAVDAAARPDGPRELGEGRSR